LTPLPVNLVSAAAPARGRQVCAVRYGPASRTMTRYPASASLAAITEPPAPLPTTHTSASRAVSPVGFSGSIRTSDGWRGSGDSADGGPAYPIDGQFGFTPPSSTFA